ncbi:MAG: cation:proton antiporter [Candidatus Nitrosoglobus sp.]|jgi:CPA1 family monovalent cation:H+ antiporter
MDILNIITILVVLAAILGYLNARFLKLPDTIGLMIIAIVFSTLTIVVGSVFPELFAFEKELVTKIDFTEVLLNGFLSIFLFAGALQTDADSLKTMRGPVLLFATAGVLISALLIGAMMFVGFGLLNFKIPFTHCLLFGALISPTDPIAVLGILKKAGISESLEMKIVGESLFNDGMGVAIFLTVFLLAQLGGGEITSIDIILLFIEEIGGGILLGFSLGYVAYFLMRSIDNHQIEILITLALVLGGYWLASQLNFSGPLAMAVTGLMVGHKSFRADGMSKTTENYVDEFWELLELFFSAILFLLIGLQLIIISFNLQYLLVGVLTIPIVLLARYVAVFFPLYIFEKSLELALQGGIIMTWGGLRGGISIALALALEPSMSRELLLTVCYIVVAFSIVVQGLTVERLAKKYRSI